MADHDNGDDRAASVPAGGRGSVRGIARLLRDSQAAPGALGTLARLRRCSSSAGTPAAAARGFRTRCSAANAAAQRSSRDRLRALFDSDPPSEDGIHVADAVEALFRDQAPGFVSPGGKLPRALPDRRRREQARARQTLTVMVSAKPNRSQPFPGLHAFILPFLSRSEGDAQANGDQAISVGDSFSMISGAVAHREPAPDPLTAAPAAP